MSARLKRAKKAPGTPGRRSISGRTPAKKDILPRSSLSQEQRSQHEKERLALKRIGITCVCFNMRKAARLVTNYYDEFLAEAGLSSTQFALIASIGRHKNLTISELADQLLTDRTTLTRNMKPLEKMGLLRHETAGDKRKRYVVLTSSGWDAINRAIPQWEAAQSSVVSKMGDEDHRSLLKYLWRFVYGKVYLDA